VCSSPPPPVSCLHGRSAHTNIERQSRDTERKMMQRGGEKESECCTRDACIDEHHKMASAPTCTVLTFASKVEARATLYSDTDAHTTMTILNCSSRAAAARPMAKLPACTQGESCAGVCVCVCVCVCVKERERQREKGSTCEVLSLSHSAQSNILVPVF